MYFVQITIIFFLIKCARRNETALSFINIFARRKANQGTEGYPKRYGFLSYRTGNKKILSYSNILYYIAYKYSVP